MWLKSLDRNDVSIKMCILCAVYRELYLPLLHIIANQLIIHFFKQLKSTFI